MKKVKIVGIKSEICWWRSCVGQICPVLDIYKETGFIKIKVKMHDPNVILDPDYEVEGWIDPDFVVEVKE